MYSSSDEKSGFIVAGDGKGVLESVEYSMDSVEISEDAGELGELGGCWLDSGVTGGVKIHGLFLILRIQCWHKQRSQKIQAAIIEKMTNIV
jgi:hypothetical protein